MFTKSHVGDGSPGSPTASSRAGVSAPLPSVRPGVTGVSEGIPARSGVPLSIITPHSNSLNLLTTHHQSPYRPHIFNSYGGKSFICLSNACSNFFAVQFMALLESVEMEHVSGYGIIRSYVWNNWNEFIVKWQFFSHDSWMNHHSANMISPPFSASLAIGSSGSKFAPFHRYSSNYVWSDGKIDSNLVYWIDQERLHFKPIHKRNGIVIDYLFSFFFLLFFFFVFYFFFSFSISFSFPFFSSYPLLLLPFRCAVASL